MTASGLGAELTIEEKQVSKKVAVIICAAGPGTRFGGKRKKQFVDVAGRAVFVRSVEMFANRDDVAQVLLGISEEDQELVEIKWGSKLAFFGVKVFYGGAERFETIDKAIALLKDDIELVAIHDACRCCVTEPIIDDVFAAAAKSGAAIPACPVTATIKEAKEDIITKTVDRSNLFEAQTPQVFETALLKEAYANLDNLDKAKVSDDAFLVEALGREVTLVQTDSSNIKITRPSDIPIAEAIIKSRPKPKPEGPIGPYNEAIW